MKQKKGSEGLPQAYGLWSARVEVVIDIDTEEPAYDLDPQYVIGHNGELRWFSGSGAL